MHYLTTPAIAAVCATVWAGAVQAEDRIYGPFPVTVKGYQGAATNSVQYNGQIARHVLHESLKTLSARGDGNADAKLKAHMEAYFSGKEDGRAILAPQSKEGFPILQTKIEELSGNTELASKTYKGAISGWPNNMTGPEVIQFWIDKAASAKGGFDLQHGYEYPQLISKFLIGSVFYNQVVDVYLDENLAADVKPNDQPYSKGAPYTGKEHSWDEAFGYFGVSAHALSLSPQQIHDIAKQKPAALKAADRNGDGKVDLRSEMTFAPAAYAAEFDVASAGSKNATRYVHTIVEAFYEGRKLLAEAKGAKLTDAQRAKLKSYAGTIEEAWERVLAEAVFKYAGSVYEDLKKVQAAVDAKGNPEKALTAYVHHWGELKGFSLALQTGRKNLGETATRLNRLIGYGPVLPERGQVQGITNTGVYLQGVATSPNEYMLHMLRVQQLMTEAFAVKARVNDRLQDVKALSNKLSAGGHAEND